MKVIIPVSLLTQIEEKIQLDWRLTELKEKQLQKLIKRLVELWYFVYNRQIEDNDAKNLDFYTDISKVELMRFSIMLSGLRLYYTDLISIISPLIKSNDTYFKGRYYIGYKVNTNFLQFTNLTEYEIDFNVIFTNTKNKEYWIDKYPKQENLINDSYNSSIDLDSYLNWMNNNVGIKLKPVYNKKTGLLEERILDQERICHHFNLALKINLKNLWFKVSNEGRFYSSISNLPDNAVNYIMIDGDKTERIDIKNCQPLLLTTIIHNDKFKKDCELGIFYDNIGNELRANARSTISRSEVKLMCYKHIFFGSKQLKSGMLYDAMENVYPGLISKINSLKQDKCLAKTLQQIESDLFVNKIGKLKINKLLRHDEVVVKIKDVKKIKEILVKEFYKLNIKFY